jgi:hypothetical protein
MNKLFVAAAMLVLLPAISVAQLPTRFASIDADTIKARISELNPPDKGLPENELSLNDERRAVDSEIATLRRRYQGPVDRSKDIEAIDKAKATIAGLVNEITKANCKALPQGRFQSGGKIVSELEALELKAFRLDLEDEPNPWVTRSSPYKDEGKAGDTELCSKWKAFLGDQARQQTLMAYFDALKVQLGEQAKKASEAKSTASALLEILQKRKDAIEKKLVSSNTQASLTSNLWVLIVVIGLFSIGTIAAVKLFNPEIQIEWVASGQVIQFVTVMILLSVVMALGLAGILKENTLGTLLGGIAGYVLAQGVGRAAAREVSRGRTGG